MARKSALTYKAKNNAIVVVEDFTLEAPKTKEFVTIAKNLKWLMESYFWFYLRKIISYICRPEI